MGQGEIEGPIGEKCEGQRTDRCPPLRHPRENGGSFGGKGERGDDEEHSRGIQLGKKGEKEKRGIERGVEAVLAGSETHVETEDLEDASGGKRTQGVTCWAFRSREVAWKRKRSRCGDRMPFRLKRDN